MVELDEGNQHAKSESPERSINEVRTENIFRLHPIAKQRSKIETGRIFRLGKLKLKLLNGKFSEGATRREKFY